MGRAFLIIAAVAGAVVLAAVVLLLLGGSPDAPQSTVSPPSVSPVPAPGRTEAERKFHEDFDRAMKSECNSTAIATASRLGRTGPEVEEELRRRCDCAVEVVGPMSMADKLALAND